MSNTQTQHTPRGIRLSSSNGNHSHKQTILTVTPRDDFTQWRQSIEGDYPDAEVIHLVIGSMTLSYRADLIILHPNLTHMTLSVRSREWFVTGLSLRLNPGGQILLDGEDATWFIDRLVPPARAKMTP